jgi:hypothetical protein
MRKLIAIVLLISASSVFPCAPAPHAGEEITIAEESAVIVWDPATRTEHFIRRATFDGKAHDFGFLVPTPSAPTLTAVDDRIFEMLQELTARQTITIQRSAVDWTPFVMMPFLLRKDVATTAGAPVEVLSTEKVAGYEAVVLDATDAAALHRWLDEHGYATTPDLTAWAAPYIAAHWKITAFKIDKSQPEMTASTSAVKMSFTTDRPFFPYREPASQKDVPYGSRVRSLRVFFLGPERVRGLIGASTSWPGVLEWSNTLYHTTREELAQRSAIDIAETSRLTAFIDTSVVREGDEDLFFIRDVDQRAFAQPPWVHENVDTTHVPLDLAMVPIMLIAFAFWRRNHAEKA